MAAPTQPLAPTAPATSRTLGESMAIVTAGPWFSAATSSAFADVAAEVYESGATSMVLDLTEPRAAPRAHRRHQPAARAELLEQRGRQLLVRGRGNGDRVVGRARRMAEPAVADDELHALDPGGLEVRRRLRAELGDDLDADDT